MNNKRYFIGIAILFFVIIVSSIYTISKISYGNNEYIEAGKEEMATMDYEDDNNIPVALYYNNGHTRQKVKDIYRSDWREDSLLISLGAFYTDVDEMKKTSFSTNWYEWYNKYAKAGDCRIGYELEIKRTNGENIRRTIIKPSDLEGLYGYVQIYLYDDIHQLPNSWYSHLEDDDYTSSTLLSSIKLVASSSSELVISPLKLTVFTYNGLDDFDENGFYRGNSSYTVFIHKS